MHFEVQPTRQLWQSWVFAEGSTLNSRAFGLSMAILTAFSWAILAIGLKYTVQILSPGTIVWFRMLIAALGLGLIFAVKSREQLLILRRPPKLAIAAGLLLAANYFGFMKGIELTTASNAQIMIQLAPMSLILIGLFYFKERPSPLQGVGFVTALLGFSMFFWDQIRISAQNMGGFVEGNLWIVMAAATWALFATFQKLVTVRWSPQQVNLIVYVLSMTVLWPLATPSELSSLSIPHWMLVVALGLNTLLAYGALGEALKRIPASQVSIILAANPLLTLFLMQILTAYEVTWIAPEPIEWRGYIGALAVVTGVSMAVSRPRRS